jgi:hypothetical protein
MHTFIAHARADEFFVRQIVAVLERFGFATWWDTSYESAELIQRHVHDAIGYAHAFIFVVSPQAIESRHVQAEIELARELAIPIIPILRTRRRDLAPQQWQSLLEQSLALDACDPEALDEVFDLLLSRLEAIVDRSPPRYVSAHHILREMKADEYFGLPGGGASIRPQIEEVVSEFGALAGSLDLFDRIEESIGQQRGTPRYCETSRSFDAAPAEDAISAVADVRAALGPGQEKMVALCQKLGLLTKVVDLRERVEGSADRDVWGWTRASAGTHLTADGVSCTFWPEPSTRFRPGGDEWEAAQNCREVTDSLSRVAAGGRDRREKSERLLAELGLHSLSTLLIQALVRAIEARSAENVSAVISEAISEAVHATLLSAEIADAGATGLPKGMIVDLVDILDSNAKLAKSGARPVALRPLWRDVDKASGEPSTGGVVFAGTGYSKTKALIVGSGKAYSDQGDSLVGLANCMNLINLTTRPQ